MQRVCKHLAPLVAYDIDVPGKWRQQIDNLV